MYSYFNMNLKGDAACRTISPVHLLFCIVYPCIDRSWVMPRKTTRLTRRVMRYTKKYSLKGAFQFPTPLKALTWLFQAAFCKPRLTDGKAPLFAKTINFHITLGFHQTSSITCSAMLGASHTCQRAWNSSGGLSNARVTWWVCNGRSTSGTAPGARRRAPPTAAQGASEPF